ncbi:MAG: hypothetical protein ACLU99_01665 [Alphaproteobacteria bacterium]
MADNSFDNEMIPYVEFADNANERTPACWFWTAPAQCAANPLNS